VWPARKGYGSCTWFTWGEEAKQRPAEKNRQKGKLSGEEGACTSHKIPDTPTGHRHRAVKCTGNKSSVVTELTQ